MTHIDSSQQDIAPPPPGTLYDQAHCDSPPCPAHSLQHRLCVGHTRTTRGRPWLHGALGACLPHVDTNTPHLTLTHTPYHRCQEAARPARRSARTAARHESNLALPVLCTSPREL
ncbi:hypothetical protein T492DRAFT_421348 [Pavlovales sp. CCMP2436]|nr:hypothetical protein T492DRAFT_421348 [Pavlovales sp. CCMP2436]